MRILLADDHAIVRSGLRRILEDEFAGATVGEAGSCAELRRQLAEKCWDLLILDIALGEENGLSVLPELKKERRRLPVIVLSMYGERQFVIRALRAGVSGYLTKERAPEELLQAIRTVLQGKRYIGEAVALQIAEYVALDGPEAPHETLSAREHEVFLLLAGGKSVSEIAALLGLSVKTVSTYRSRILEKMDMSSNAALMRYGLENGLVR